MAPKQSSTCLSSSGKVEYAITNHVAFLGKESVHEDFHPLMDFFNNSPVSYALTASPIIYAQIVEEMWSSACSSEGQIKLQIKGKSYVITPSVINEALHLPNANFENLPTDEEIIIMLYSIKYASKTSLLGQISRKYLRKEWSYFFDTLTKVFTGKCGGYDAIIRFVQKIAYSLIYNRTIDIGSLLLYEFSYKLGDLVKRSKVIYYARFFMIIANHLCKGLVIKNKDDTLQVFVQSKQLFSNLVKNNFHAKVKFVLPKHIRVQLSTLSSSPSPVPAAIDTVRNDPLSPIEVVLPSQSQSGTKTTFSVSGKRKKSTFCTITGDGDEENEMAMEVNSPRKKINANIVKPELRLFSEDPETPPGFFRDGVPVVGLSLEEEEKPKCELRFVLEPTLEPFSLEKMLPQDHLHLLNAASVLKSQLVARLKSDANKLSTEDRITLANRCYYALRELGDDCRSFRSKVDKLIEQKPFSLEKMLPRDRLHLLNAASVLKSQLVARLKSDANKLSTEDRITLANRCYYALCELGDDCRSFRSEVDKLIEQHEELESVSRKKENWNDQVITTRYIQQAMSVSDVMKKLSSVEDKLSEAKTNVGSIKLKREELTGTLLKLEEELYEEEERVKILTAEWDRCKEGQIDAKAELRKLDIEKEEARVALKAINDQYNTAKERCERLYNQLLQLARKR